MSCYILSVFLSAVLHLPVRAMDATSSPSRWGVLFCFSVDFLPARVWGDLISARFCWTRVSGTWPFLACSRCFPATGRLTRLHPRLGSSRCTARIRVRPPSCPGIARCPLTGRSAVSRATTACPELRSSFTAGTTSVPCWTFRPWFLHSSPRFSRADPGHSTLADPCVRQPCPWLRLFPLRRLRLCLLVRRQYPTSLPCRWRILPSPLLPRLHQRIRGLRLMLLRPLPRIQCLLPVRSPSHQPCLIMIWPPRPLVSIFIITALMTLMWCMLLGRRFPLTRPAHRTHSMQSSFTALHVVHALTVTAWNLSAVPCLRPLLHACTAPVAQPCPLKVWLVLNPNTWFFVWGFVCLTPRQCPARLAATLAYTASDAAKIVSCHAIRAVAYWHMYTCPVCLHDVC